MPNLKIFADEQVAKVITDQLQQRGIEVLRCADVNLLNTDDTILLSYATKHGYTMLSFDDDFESIHAAWLKEGKSHCGIFRCLPHLQGKSGIGTIITFVTDFDALIDAEAGTLQEDVYNKIIHIS